MPENKKKLIPISGVVYGETIYWLTLLSSALVLLGTMLSFLETQSPTPASYLLNAVISGKNVDELWAGSGLAAAPDMLFYLGNASHGESITMIGIAAGVSSVIPATFLASYFLWKSRNPAFSVLAVAAGVITCVAVSGASLG